MKKILVLLLVLVPFLAAFVMLQPKKENNQVVWVTDYAKAVKDAKKQKKTLLLNFTGSDWCGWCIKLDKEVFAKKEFVDYAKKNLICVKLDFPKKKKITPEEKVQNQKLLDKYKVEGFPTILLLNGKEDLLLTTGYQAGGATSYVEHLKSAIK